MHPKKSLRTLVVTLSAGGLILGVLGSANARATSLAATASARSYASLLQELDGSAPVMIMDLGGVIIPIDPPELSPITPVLPLP